MRYLRPLLVVLMVVTVGTRFSTAETEYCQQSRQLSKYEGEYARKDVWNRLPLATDWRSMEQTLSSGTVISITIPSDGRFTPSVNHWHEGSNGCIRRKGNEFWATADVDYTGGGSETEFVLQTNAKWEGPFIRVGPAFSERSLYFHRIFGTRCFRSETNESWCFGPGYIQVDDHNYSAELPLDTSEQPQYGFPVHILDRPRIVDFWVFVRSGHSWKVYREPFGDSAPSTHTRDRKPWKTLTPASN